MMAKNSSERFGSLKAVADELATILKSPAPKAATKDRPASAKAPPPTGDRIRGDVGASQVLKSFKQKAVTASDLLSLEELAGKCYSRRDFEQVIQIVERIPEKKRNAGLVALLDKARSKADEIAFLICEIDEADRLNDVQTALKKAEALLAIKPGHYRALKVQEKYSGYGEGSAARIGVLDQFRRPLNNGGWIPWSVLACGLAVFGVMTGVIVIYLNRTAVVIDIQDPGVEVAVKGTTLTVTGPDQQSVKVVPGDQELTISSAGLETITKSFTIKKGEKRTVTVSIMGPKLAAWLDNELGPLTAAREEKATSPTAGGTKALPLLTPAHNESATATLPGTFTNKLGMEFVLVPKGKSWLGGGGGKLGKREVVMAHDFYLGKYEVTQEEWEKVMGLTPSHFSRTGDGKNRVTFISDADLKRFPVENVSWNDAQAFLEHLNKGEQESGWVYRLPKEAEWEYACRGGPQLDKFDCGFDFYFDKPANQMSPEQANFIEKGKGLKRSCKVGSYKPNPLGLYDMHGNVNEWCGDAQKVAGGALQRVLRGGAWDYAAAWANTAAFRDVAPPSTLRYDWGLRVARVPIDPAPSSAPQLLVAPFDEATAHKGQEAWASHLRTRVHLSNAIGMQLALIPPGEFQMGSADTRLAADVRPVHRVRITKPFYVGIYEVTQEEFQRVMDANPSQFRSDPRLPVESMSGQDMQDFCRKLSLMPAEKQAGRTYRLLTEAEWEYACRAGTTTLFHFGDVMSSDQANFDGDHPGFDLPHGPILGRTTKVGSYRPNAFGLYDMHGNVIEVVSDLYSADYYSTSPVDNPQGPTSKDYGVGRGGGWRNPATPSAYRFTGPRSTVDPVLGFRVVCDLAVSSVPGTSTASRELPLPSAFTVHAPADENRRAAEWVLSLGGNVWIRESGTKSEIKIRTGWKLPATSFELTRIDVSSRAVRDSDLAILKGLAHLNVLNLEKTAVSDAGLSHLKRLTNLSDLNLGSTQISDAALAHLRDLTNLRTLHLWGNPRLGDAGLAHLKSLTNLNFLSLFADREVSDSGLAQLEGMVSLTVLDLNATHVTDAGLVHLKYLTKLTSLNLMSTRISGAGFIHLKGLTNLRDLHLSNSTIGDIGVAHLEGMNHLAWLALNDTQVTDGGLTHLKNLTNLRRLGLTNTQVSDAGLLSLKGMRQLADLDLSRTQVTAAGVAKLKAALPNCNITQ